jgi:hypothetical protein
VGQDDLQNGWASHFQAMVQHYQSDNAATTISQAYQAIENLRDTNQQEVFSTQLKKMYDRLGDNGIAILTAEKLRVINSRIDTRITERNWRSRMAPMANGTALMLQRFTEIVGDRMIMDKVTKYPPHETRDHGWLAKPW